MATESGGSAFFPTTMKEIEEAYDTIVSQVRAQHARIRLNQHGDRRTLAQGGDPSAPSAGSGTRIQARKGYFAPYREN